MTKITIRTNQICTLYYTDTRINPKSGHRLSGFKPGIFKVDLREMFRIKAKELELKLEIVPLDVLCQHEKTFPQLENELILEFNNWANLQNPIIVDENLIVLDGNHRASVFKALNYKYILVCKIDYFHKTACLRYWFRRLSNIQNIETVKQIVEGLGGRLREIENKVGLEKTLEEDCFCCGIQTGNLYAAVGFPKDIVYDSVSAYDILEKIQNRLIQNGIKLEYIPCQYVQDHQFCEQLKDEEMLIWTPQITKEMVVEAARQEKLFAPKSTRHLIPARPLNVNIPIFWFKENISLEEINRKVCEYLENKKLKRFGPGQVIDGRYYEEELFVFYDYE